MQKLQHRYSKELLKDYSVFGFFYKITNQKGEYRSILEIIRKKKFGNIGKYILNSVAEPDLLAIMMNPGKSSPVIENEIYKIKGYDSLPELYKKLMLVETKPDRTQYQLMRVMDAFPNINRLRVINLSDIRQPKSGKLSVDLKGKGDSHSLFSNARSAELNVLLPLNVPVIMGHGSEDNLVRYAIIAHKVVKGNKVVGVRRPDDNIYFQHPLRRFYKNSEWVKSIVEQLKS